MTLYTKNQSLDVKIENTTHYLKTVESTVISQNNVSFQQPVTYSIQTIEDHLTSSIKANGFKIRNVNESISLMQVASSAIDKIIQHLQEIRDIALKAINQVLPTNQQDEMQHKVHQLVHDIRNIVQVTEFNGHSLFKENAMSMLSSLNDNFHEQDVLNQMTIFNGTALDDYLNMLESIKVQSLNAQKDNISGNAYVMISDIDRTLKALSHEQSQFHKIQNRFENQLNDLQLYSTHLTEYQSKIKSMREAEKNTHFTYDQILQHVPNAILAQANNSHQSVVNLLSSY